MTALRDRGITIDGEAAAIALFAAAFAGRTEELLQVAHLDRDRHLLACRIYESDLCDSVAFPLRIMIGDALRLETDGLIVAHNHPSGDPTPSRTDLMATRALVALARPLGIRVHDHLIFAGAATRSLRAMGLL